MIWNYWYCRISTCPGIPWSTPHLPQIEACDSEAMGERDSKVPVWRATPTPPQVDANLAGMVTGKEGRGSVGFSKKEKDLLLWQDFPESPDLCCNLLMEGIFGRWRCRWNRKNGGSRACLSSTWTTKTSMPTLFQFGICFNYTCVPTFFMSSLRWNFA